MVPILWSTALSGPENHTDVYLGFIAQLNQVTLVEGDPPTTITFTSTIPLECVDQCNKTDDWRECIVTVQETSQSSDIMYESAFEIVNDETQLSCSLLNGYHRFSISQNPFSNESVEFSIAIKAKLDGVIDRNRDFDLQFQLRNSSESDVSLWPNSLFQTVQVGDIFQSSIFFFTYTAK